MKKWLFIFGMCSLNLLFGFTGQQAEQQLAKYNVGRGELLNQSYPYIYGFHEMNVTGVGTPLINYILSTITSPPIALTNTTGMINAATLPIISKYMLLVSPARYNASLPAGENMLIKDMNLFGTIQSAINFAVQSPDNTAVFGVRWTILVDPGTYLENLAIQRPGPLATQTISITLAALGLVTLGDGAATGNVNWFVDNNPFLTGQRYPSLLFTVYRTNDTNYNARWIITNNFTFTRKVGFAGTTLMQLHYVTLQGTLTCDFIRADFYECVFAKPVSIAPANTGSYLYGAQGCLFKDVVQTYYYGKVVGCVFLNGMQCNHFNLFGVYSETAAGFYRSQLQGNFTMVSADKYYIDKFTDAASSATIANKQVIQ
jgi:hypothetical protein